MTDAILMRWRETASLTNVQSREMAPLIIGDQRTLWLAARCRHRYLKLSPIFSLNAASSHQRNLNVKIEAGRRR